MKITEETKCQVLEMLLEDRYTLQEIADEMGVSKYIVQKVKKENNLE